MSSKSVILVPKGPTSWIQATQTLCTFIFVSLEIKFDQQVESFNTLPSIRSVSSSIIFMLGFTSTSETNIKEEIMRLTSILLVSVTNIDLSNPFLWGQNNVIGDASIDKCVLFMTSKNFSSIWKINNPFLYGRKIKKNLKSLNCPSKWKDSLFILEKSTKAYE